MILISFLKIVLTGIGATALVDVWTLLLSLFKVKSLDYRFVGRWIAHFKEGKFVHKNIMSSLPVRGEVILGWVSHYLIGISFAFLLILCYGTDWLGNPHLLPALVIGLITLAAPLFIMQPAFGFGLASSKLPNPNARRFKSLLTHTVYGIGLYGSALLLNQLW
jgi:hypothetical protein